MNHHQITTATIVQMQKHWSTAPSNHSTSFTLHPSEQIEKTNNSTCITFIIGTVNKVTQLVYQSNCFGTSVEILEYFAYGLCQWRAWSSGIWAVFKPDRYFAIITTQQNPQVLWQIFLSEKGVSFKVQTNFTMNKHKDKLAQQQTYSEKEYSINFLLSFNFG